MLFASSPSKCLVCSCVRFEIRVETITLVSVGMSARPVSMSSAPTTRPSGLFGTMSP